MPSSNPTGTASSVLCLAPAIAASPPGAPRPTDVLLSFAVEERTAAVGALD